MDHIIYYFARLVIALFQAMPIRWVARLGRFGGGMAFWLDKRHRVVALKNLTMIFAKEKSAGEIRALARENFRRLGEIYCCIMKTAGMSDDGIRSILSVKGGDALKGFEPDGKLSNRVLSSGHFGNFELATRIGAVIPGYRALATYRGIKPAKLNDLLVRMRTVSGNLVFDRRTGADELKRAMSQGGLLLTLAVDQADRSGGLELPFMGYYAWTTRAPVVLAMRYKCALFVPICYRVGLAQWTVEIGEPVAMQDNGKRRSVEDILRDINVRLEAAVRRDPANWFWVHNRWKTKRGIPPRPVEL